MSRTSKTKKSLKAKHQQAATAHKIEAGTKSAEVHVDANTNTKANIEMNMNAKPAADTKIEAQSASKAVNRPKTKVSAVASLALLISLLNISVLGYLAWQQYQRRELNHITQQEMAHQLRQQLSAVQQQQAVAQQQATTRSQMLEAQQQQLFHLSQRRGAHQDIWILNEVDYLLRLCWLNMVFEPDHKKVVTLLELAEQRLAHVAQPEAMTIRQQLKQIVNQVRAHPGPDLAKLFVTLKALAKDSQNLESLTDTPVTKIADTTSVAADEVATEVPSWRSQVKHYAQMTWHALGQIVVVRRVKPELPLLLPDEQQSVHQRIQLLLEQARWAALQQHPVVYQATLKEISHYVDSYFLADTKATQQFKVRLSELMQVVVRPEWPSLKPVLRNVRHLEHHSTTTSSKEE